MLRHRVISFDSSFEDVTITQKGSELLTAIKSFQPGDDPLTFIQQNFGVTLLESPSGYVNALLVACDIAVRQLLNASYLSVYELMRDPVMDNMGNSRGTNLWLRNIATGEREQETSRFHIKRISDDPHTDKPRVRMLSIYKSPTGKLLNDFVDAVVKVDPSNQLLYVDLPSDMLTGEHERIYLSGILYPSRLVNNLADSNELVLNVFDRFVERKRQNTLSTTVAHSIPEIIYSSGDGTDAVLEDYARRLHSPTIDAFTQLYFEKAGDNLNRETLTKILRFLFEERLFIDINQLQQIPLPSGKTAPRRHFIFMVGWADRYCKKFIEVLKHKPFRQDLIAIDASGRCFVDGEQLSYQNRNQKKLNRYLVIVQQISQMANRKIQAYISNRLEHKLRIEREAFTRQLLDMSNFGTGTVAHREFQDRTLLNLKIIASPIMRNHRFNHQIVIRSSHPFYKTDGFFSPFNIRHFQTKKMGFHDSSMNINPDLFVCMDLSDNDRQLVIDLNVDIFSKEGAILLRIARGANDEMTFVRQDRSIETISGIPDFIILPHKIIILKSKEESMVAEAVFDLYENKPLTKSFLSRFKKQDSRSRILEFIISNMIIPEPAENHLPKLVYLLEQLSPSVDEKIHCLNTINQFILYNRNLIDEQNKELTSGNIDLELINLETDKTRALIKVYKHIMKMIRISLASNNL